MKKLGQFQVLIHYADDKILDTVQGC